MSAIHRWFPGEQEAVETVKRLGAEYGYGNLINRLKDSWSANLQAGGIPKASADMAAGLVCAWCKTDCRTGKKARKKERKP